MIDYLDNFNTRINYISLIILFCLTGPAVFLICYPEKSIIGFTVLILLFFFSFILFRIKPKIKELPEEVSSSEIKKVKEQIKRKIQLYERYHLNSYIYILIFTILIPIIGAVFYFIGNQKVMNYLLSLSLVGLGISIIFLYRFFSYKELLKNLGSKF